MKPYTIFVVDDEPTIREGIALNLDSKYRIKTFAMAEDALAALGTEKPDLVLLDIGLPGMSGLDALPKIKECASDILVIVITAFEDVKTVVSSMKGGAHDYVVKPLHADTLNVTIRNALETVRLKREVRHLQERYLRENLPVYIAESDVIQNVMGLLGRLAKSSDTPILIQGETGTGKEFIARAIHYLSPNFNGQLVSVNFAAIPKDLIESELFGYEGGAFTRESAGERMGLVEQAAGGTLFLDEVADMSMEVQAKLLRFLDEGEYYRVGGTRKHKVRTRIVSATNRNLQSLIDEGRFREDLYYRIAVLKVEVPSLNDRREDILPIARHFLVEFGEKFEKPFTGISPEAEEALCSHRFKGNVRELRNIIERGVLIGKGPLLLLQDVGLEVGSRDVKGGGRALTDEPGDGICFPPLPPGGINIQSSQEALERFYVVEAVLRTGGNEANAAMLLGDDNHTFRYRRRKLGV
jgi:DNA-binding NtrC family response regulator